MLHKDIANRLRAGARVVLVEDSDEQLAVTSAKIAGKAFPTVEVVSSADQEVLTKVENHKSSQGGLLILCDFLRAYGQNPVAARLLREIALLNSDGLLPRLILIEVPGVEVPASLRGDIEYLIPKLPDVKDLVQELEMFVKTQDGVKLDAKGETKTAIAAAVTGIGRHEANRLFARCWVEKQTLDPVWLRTEKAHRVSERLGGALSFVDTEDVPDVGGQANLKAWTYSRKKAFGSEAAKKFGLPESKGLLLFGIPGTGKSLSPKTIARDWGLPLLRGDIGKVFGSLVGQSESQMRQLIDAAEASAPCILWIDELEKAFGEGGLDGGTSKRVLGTFLTWLQEKKKPVFVIATANRIDLPPELLRKGRFDEIFFVDLPTLDERAEIARIHIVRRERDPKKISPVEIAKATEGFGGAEIEQAIIDGLFAAFSQERDVTLEDILAAARATTPLSTTMKSEIDRLREWAKNRARSASAQASQVAPSAVQGTKARRVAVI